jgi:serine/threonine protein kinase
MIENYRTATINRAPDWSEDVGSTTRTASVPLPVAAAPEALLLTPGKSYGPYLIIRHLGAGGMGQVFLAQDVRLGRHDAVKSLAGKWLTSRIARQRLLREARSAAALTHPNIATVYDVFEDGQHVLLVMEYVEGRSLRDVIGAGPVPPNYALRLIVQIADAIGYAHDRGIVHCDLKPANVQLTPEGTAKVLDFGLARATFALDDEVSASDQGRIIGTPGYIAPELLLTGTNAPSGDVYSLGVMLFELLTGRHPFEETGPARILSILAGVAPSVTSLAPGVPGVMDGIVDRALARDPAQRYQSAHELARDLRAVLQTHEQRMLGSWTTPRGLAALGVGVILALTLAGCATSTFYNSPLGLTDGFNPESALGWPLWGIRSLVAPLGYMLLFGLTFQVARVALQLVLSVPPLRRRLNLLSSLWSLLDAALRRARSRTLAAMLLLAQLGVVVLLFWRFQPLFAGLDSFVTQRSPAQLEIFSPRHLGERNDFFFLLFACVTVFGYGWYSLARGGRAYSERGAAGLIAAGIAITAMCLFFGQVLPYRVLTKSRAERVTYRSSVCYLVGQRRDEGMLFCPLDPPPWKHVVRLDDPALKRVGRYESIFTGFD